MNFKSRNKVTLSPNNSSMTDLLFLLLIFFIILSTLAVTNAVEIDLPSTAENNVTDKPNSPYRLAIDADGNHYVNDKPIDAENIEAEIKNLITNPSSTVTVLMMVDGKVPTDITIKALSKIKKNQWQVSIATQKI